MLLDLPLQLLLIFEHRRQQTAADSSIAAFCAIMSLCYASKPDKAYILGKL